MALVSSQVDLIKQLQTSLQEIWLLMIMCGSTRNIYKLQSCISCSSVSIISLQIVDLPVWLLRVSGICEGSLFFWPIEIINNQKFTSTSQLHWKSWNLHFTPRSHIQPCVILIICDMHDNILLLQLKDLQNEEQVLLWWRYKNPQICFKYIYCGWCYAK